MDAGIINVIYMELYSGPKMANGTCGKTIVTGTIDRGSTVFAVYQRYRAVSLTDTAVRLDLFMGPNSSFV
jgi:hypothetical protein